MPNASEKNQGGASDAQNIPAQKASEKKGTRLQKENEDIRRQKRSQETSCKRQKETDLLIPRIDRYRNFTALKVRKTLST